ncbi:uncharacterized protein BYT42DRAFT_526655 [Radiomyces spectabilis]|uniref:uncharacterized protein n=1 Tax=Radiomyces spectabilis TaxID=64574 RepID=UPI00221EE74B|nr:uncharacterized protein BYT42DRAFT_526655 [Radiomyces spectabilis]KAI8391243.1 hypothetical protein BYT42DRAFT_526655 [Radiomyces spectabilis]
MVHLRCRNVHSKVTECVSQRLFSQWRTLLLETPCEGHRRKCRGKLSYAAKRALSTDSKQDTAYMHSFLKDIDECVGRNRTEPATLIKLDKEKKIAQKRIPPHVTSEVAKHIRSPLALSIHSLAEAGESAKAWEAFQAFHSSHANHIIPFVTAQKLLHMLEQDVSSLSSSLTSEQVDLRQLYHRRLESLLNHLQRSDTTWSPEDFSTILQIFGKLGHIERIEAVVRNRNVYCKDPITTDNYNMVMLAYLNAFNNLGDQARRRYVSKMISLLRQMEQRGVSPDTTTFNALIAAKLKTGDFAGAEEVLAKLKATANLKPNRTTYHSLLNAYLRSCRHEDVIKANVWMDEMIDAGMIPSVYTFNNIISGITRQVEYYRRIRSNSDMQSAVKSVKALYDLAVQLGVKPDIITANCLLTAYSAANDKDALKKVVDLLDIRPRKTGCGNCGCGSGCQPKTIQPDPIEKPPIKFTPNTHTYNILIRHYLRQHNLDEAFVTYDSMATSGLLPNAETYANFINYYVRQANIPEALKYYDVMRKKGICSNQHIFNVLMVSLFKDPAHADAVEARLRTMMMDDIDQDVVSYNTRMTALSVKDDVDDTIREVADLFEQMNAQGLKPAAQTYNIAMNVLGNLYKRKDRQRHDAIETVLKSILDSIDIKADLLTYALTIRNYVYRQDMNGAERTFKKLVKSGLKPNEFVFTHLVVGYSQAGEMEKAQRVIHHMVHAPYHIRPTAFIYAPLIQGYVDAAEYEKAYDTFRSMIDQGITADLPTYTILAKMFLKSAGSSNGVRAIELLKDLRKMSNDGKSNLRLDLQVLTVMIEAHGIAGARSLDVQENGRQKLSLSQVLEQRDYHIKKVQDICDEIQQQGFDLDDKAITTILTSYRRLEKPELAWKFWNSLSSKRMLAPSYRHYDALLSCFSHNKLWYPVCKNVFESMMNERIFEGSTFTSDPHQVQVEPDAVTFDVMIEAAVSASDMAGARTVWRLPSRPRLAASDSPDTAPKLPLIRTYCLALEALIKSRDATAAQETYREVLSIPEQTISEKSWRHKIQEMAKHHGLTEA